MRAGVELRAAVDSSVSESARSGATSVAPRSRLDAFDGMRALLAMLFLVLHASLAYLVTPLGALWPFKDSSTHVGFDVAAALIHSFRLPLFFILAGFFAAMIYDERGPRGFLANRARRIALPLAAAWLVLTPIIVLAVPFADRVASVSTLRDAVRSLLDGSVSVSLQWFHLWFLFDLLIYYAIAMLCVPLVRFLPDPARRRAGNAFGALLGSPWGPVVFACVTSVTLLPMKEGLLLTPGTFVRPILTLVADGVFVLFGWGLYLRREVIPAIASRGWHALVVGIVLFTGYLFCLGRLTDGDGRFGIPAALALAGCLWFLVFGLMGLFARYYTRPLRSVRYLADASYWCYLVHLPLVIWVPLLLAEVPAPAAVKFAVVFSVTAGTCLATYHLFVRRTRIGVFLSGGRVPVRWAPPEPGPGCVRARVSPRSLPVARSSRWRRRRRPR